MGPEGRPPWIVVNRLSDVLDAQRYVLELSTGAACWSPRLDTTRVHGSGPTGRRGSRSSTSQSAPRVTEGSQLPDDDLKLGTLLALLQDDAKNQSSWLTAHVERAAPPAGLGGHGRVLLDGRRQPASEGKKMHAGQGAVKTRGSGGLLSAA